MNRNKKTGCAGRANGCLCESCCREILDNLRKNNEIIERSNAMLREANDLLARMAEDLKRETKGYRVRAPRPWAAQVILGKGILALLASEEKFRLGREGVADLSMFKTPHRRKVLASTIARIDIYSRN